MATFDSNAQTLGEFLVMSNDPKVNAVIFSLIENGSVMARDIPFLTRQLLEARGVRWEGNLPSVNWANINDQPEAVKGKPKSFQEQAFIIRNKIVTDHLLIKAENTITNPHAAQVDAYLKAVTYDFNHKFINNTHTGSGDSKAIVGIRTRLDNATDYGVLSTNKIDAAATLTAAASADNLQAFFEKLDLLLWSVNSTEGDGVVIYCNDAFLRRLSALSRRHSGSGGLSTAQDQIGRSVTKYKNATFRDIGLKADQSTKIITSTETTAGVDGGTTYTSIYAVNYSAGQFGGWNWGPMSVQDPTQTSNFIRVTEMEYVCGLYPQTNRCFGRLYNINLG